MITAEGTQRLPLIETCWPIVEFVTDFVRQVHDDAVEEPEQVRHKALSALRDAEDMCRGDARSERAWFDRIKAVMVYFLDYIMINTEWEGSLYWRDNPFETDPNVLDHPQALGGEDFFVTCDELQRGYEAADRRERPDRHDLSEQLSIYFIVLSLGFKGQYHDRPQELADYTRRLFNRLPAYATTRTNDMFPDAYKHNQEQRVDYNLGRNLTIVLTLLAIVIVGYLSLAQMTWHKYTKEIGHSSQRVEEARKPETRN